MSRPAPAPRLAALFGWFLFGAALTPVLLPPIPAYRTAVAGAAVLLFAAALAAPRKAYVLALLSAASAGVSALVFGGSEPAVAGPVALAGYFAGAALREIYDLGAPPGRPPLLPAFRAFAVAAAASAAAAFVAVRTSYLLVRGVPPPLVVNVFGDDARQALVGIAAAMASLAVAAAFHRATAALSRDTRGRRTVDVALALAALGAGGVALLQKLGALPLWRAARWQEWSRAQTTFTDPSSAGVAVALLLAPLLSRAATGPVPLRLASAGGALLLLPVLADAGSRAGFIGAVTSVLLFVLWVLTRLAGGERPGVRRRVAWTVGALAIVSSLAFAAALSWPGRGAVRSALLSRIEATFQKEPTPSERPGERLVLYEGALALFQEYPVVGIGLGRFRTEFPNAAREILLRPVRSSDNPPSLYLGALAETGLAGTALLVLLLAGLASGVGHALAFGEARADEALRAAGAAAALVGLFVVFLFGSHLVYPEIAVLFGLFAARLPIPPEGRTSRLLTAMVPVVLAGALVLMAGGVLARAYETSSPEAAFRRAATAGLYPPEREPDGRPFRWTSSAAAWRIGGPAAGGEIARRPAPALLTLAVRNARPDQKPIPVDVFWNDAWRGRVTLPFTPWRKLEMPVDGPGVLRLVPSETFRPASRSDQRVLGIETGLEPKLVPFGRAR